VRVSSSFPVPLMAASPISTDPSRVGASRRPLPFRAIFGPEIATFRVPFLIFIAAPKYICAGETVELHQSQSANCALMALQRESSRVRVNFLATARTYAEIERPAADTRPTNALFSPEQPGNALQKCRARFSFQILRTCST